MVAKRSPSTTSAVGQHPAHLAVGVDAAGALTRSAVCRRRRRGGRAPDRWRPDRLVEAGDPLGQRGGGGMPLAMRALLAAAAADPAAWRRTPAARSAAEATAALRTRLSVAWRRPAAGC
jgi:hypothetical protein